jgi:hypothetical protein
LPGPAAPVFKEPFLASDSTPAGAGAESRLDHLELFDERLIEALHAVACVARSPEALANVLEASGQVALERAGAILDERVSGQNALPGPTAS